MVYDSCLVVLGVLFLGIPSAVLNVLVPLKCTCMPFFLHSFLNFSRVFGMYETAMMMFFLLLSGGLLLLFVVGGGGGLVGVGKFVLPLVECPVWKLTML